MIKITLFYCSAELVNDINETLDEKLWSISNGDRDITITAEEYKYFPDMLGITIEETYFHALVYTIPHKEYNGFEVERIIQ